MDYDPIVLAHARALLTSHESGATEYIDADIRDTGTILDQAGELLDFTRPVAVTLLLILHVIPDSDDPYGIVARLMDRLPSGSYLAVSHLGADLLDHDTTQSFNNITRSQSQQQYIGRTREEMARFFTGLDLIDPGIVRVEQWHPDPNPGETGNSNLWCAVGRKPQ